MGLLVCFCGVDASGKTTHLRVAQELLKEAQIPHVAVKPIRTDGSFYRAIHPLMSEMSEQKQLDLFAFERYRRTLDRIVPAVKAGSVVLSDRYLYTDIAYARATGNQATLATDLLARAPRPDLTFHFDVPAEVVTRRLDGRRPNSRPSRTEDFIHRTVDEYRILAKEIGAVTIDTTKTSAKTKALVRSHLIELLEARGMWQSRGRTVASCPLANSHVPGAAPTAVHRGRSGA